MSSTKIEWCDKVWNPVTGCTFGCDYCWAEKFAKRLQGNPKMLGKYENGFAPTFHQLELRESVMKKFRKGDKIFVCDMGDLFDPAISFDDIDRVFQNVGMSEANFLFLTKRSHKMKEFTNRYKFFDISLLTRLWFGVSITDQNDADYRIPLLMQARVANRFVSVEPMRGAIDLRKYMKGLDWVICGGESGHKARPMHPDWVRSLRDQCQAAGVAFFFKGWGEWYPYFAMPFKNKEDFFQNIDHQFPLEKYHKAKLVEADGAQMDLSLFYRYRDTIEPLNQGAYPFYVSVRRGKKILSNYLDGEMWQEFPEGLK